MSVKPTVGMIGLGNLGNPMAVSLLNSGYEAVVHSLSRDEATNLLALGATWSESPAEVGRLVDEIIAVAAPRGVAVLDAPVSFLAKAPIGGSRSSAALQIFVGASTEQYEQHLPLFRALGGKPEQIYHAGPSGSGYGIKVLLNLLWFVHAAGTAEVLAMASKLGIDLRILQRALCASPSQSNFLQYDINSVLESGDYDDGFTIELVCKDLQLALALGAKTNVDIAVATIVEQLHRRALQQYGSKSGEMSVVKLYEDAVGKPFRDA